MKPLTFLKAVLLGGLVAGVLDALDGVVAFYLAFGMNPIQVLQFIASGALGNASFEGGLGTAFLGMLFHFGIAFVAAGVFALAATRVPAVKKHWLASGLAYGAWVWFFMNFVVLPQTQVAAAAPSVGLLLNGVIGHALLVGLPIAYFARVTGASRGIGPRKGRAPAATFGAWRSGRRVTTDSAVRFPARQKEISHFL